MYFLRSSAKSSRLDVWQGSENAFATVSKDDLCSFLHCVKRVQVSKCEFFLVRISPYLAQIQENKDQKKLQIQILFTQ